MADKIIKLISTFFYVGYLPIPGTIASIVGLLIYFLIKTDSKFYLAILVLLLILGFYICGRSEKVFNQKDSRKIVIDEICGMLIALFLLPASKLSVIIIVFFIYRALDTIKPPPIDKLQDLPGSMGIMLDDIVAGIYTNLIIQCSLRFTSSFAS
jgi:phosphatidylglycerophosphatase A